MFKSMEQIVSMTLQFNIKCDANKYDKRWEPDLTSI
jgi:hypothetical protein